MGEIKLQWRIQDLPKGGGADHGEHAERDPKRGSGGGAPVGSRGRAPGGGPGGKAPLKLKAFCAFFYTKSGQKLRI